MNHHAPIGLATASIHEPHWPPPAPAQPAADQGSTYWPGIAIAYAIEIFVIATIAIGGWQMVEMGGAKPWSHAWVLGLQGVALMAVPELARVPMVTMARKSRSRLWAGIGWFAVLCAVCITGKSIYQVLNESFAAREIAVVQARAAMDEAATGAKAATKPAEAGDAALDRIDAQLKQASEELKLVGKPPGPRCWTDRNGRHCATPVWRGTEVQARIKRLTDERSARQDAAANATEASADADRAAIAAHAVYDEALANSPLHKLAATFYGIALGEVTEGQVATVRFWFVLIASFATAIIGTIIAAIAVTPPKRTAEPVEQFSPGMLDTLGQHVEDKVAQANLKKAA